MKSGGAGRFVSKLVTRDDVQLHVAVVVSDAKGTWEWHKKVQPYVRDRIDGKWNWPKNYYTSALVERLRFRSIALFQIRADKPLGGSFPVAQILLADGYPFICDPKKTSVFIWYLAAAPDGVLKAAGIPAGLKTLRALVDVGIQFSFMSGYEGRVSLHAARSTNPDADLQLFNQYRHIGLLPHGGLVGAFLRRTVRRNDGRYFCVDEQLALDLSNKLDYLRQA